MKLTLVLMVAPAREADQSAELVAGLLKKKTGTAWAGRVEELQSSDRRATVEIRVFIGAACTRSGQFLPTDRLL